MNTLSIAATVPVTEAEGPGKRFAVWVQGCPFRCPGCCNPHYLSFDGDSEFMSPILLAENILRYRDEIEGVTFIGGEPFSQAEGLSEVAAIVREAELSVMVFSGFTLAQLENPGHADFASRNALLSETDLLVDGQYRQEEHLTNRRWIGSANQKVHFLTDRYLHLQDNWPSDANTIEIRYKNGELTINGFPCPEITLKSLELAKR